MAAVTQRANIIAGNQGKRMSEQSSTGSQIAAPAPHDFADHKQHMKWQTERATFSQNVPLIPQDMSHGSEGALTSSALQKALGNPFVPIGMLATVGCLVGMLSSTLKKNPKRAQLYMRGRCLAQGLTVAALVAGAMLFGIGGSDQRTVAVPTIRIAPPSADTQRQ